MPEITLQLLPDVLEKNKIIEQEINQSIKEYYKKIFIKGWSVIEGTKRWIEQNHHLILAPINDPSLGGFIFFKKKKNIFYINTYQPRIYQNFILLHEIFHMFYSNTNYDTDFLHVIELDQNSIEERKADYFASLMLLEEDELKAFFLSLEGEPIEKKIFYTMNRFLTPYKAVLIRLYELSLIDNETLRTYFDKKYDLEKEFKDIGLDPFAVQKSLVTKFSDLEELMKNKPLPRVAQDDNIKTFENVKKYFEKIV